MKVLPIRKGPRPATGPAVPHQQLSQIAPVALQEELWRRMTGLAGVRTGPSGISFPESRALHLARPGSDPTAFLVDAEFAHLHGPDDGSLHLCLPLERVADVERAGWGELHPVARAGKRPGTLLMVFGPRDEAELDVVWGLVRESHAFAVG